MSYIGLLIFIVLLAGLVRWGTKRDWLSPSFVTLVIYGISVCMAILGLFSWNNEQELSGLVVGIVLLGLVGVMTGEFLARLWLKKKPTKELKMKKKEWTIPNWVFVLTVIVAVVTIVATYFEIKGICLYYGHEPESLTDMLAFYRTKTLLFESEATTSGIKISFVVEQLQKVCYLACVFNIYFVLDSLRKYGLKQEKFKKILGVVAIILVILLSILTTSRSMMMHFAVAALIIWIILFVWNGKVKWKKVWKWLAVLAVSAIAIFYVMTPVIGRDSKMSFVEYTTFYLGTPLPSLSKVVDNEEMRSEVWGERTFYGIHYSLARVGISDEYPAQKRTGVVFGDYGGNNMFSSFGTYYLDFGMGGVILLGALFGFLTSLAYEFVKKNKHNLFVVVMFAYYYYVMIDQIRGDLFFGLFSISTLTYILIGYVMYRLYMVWGTQKCIKK